MSARDRHPRGARQLARPLRVCYGVYLSRRCSSERCWRHAGAVDIPVFQYTYLEAAAERSGPGLWLPGSARRREVSTRGRVLLHIAPIEVLCSPQKLEVRKFRSVEIGTAINITLP